MAIRFASALALAAAVLVAGPAEAQFFLFDGPSRAYALSPREIVGMLDDEGYSLRGPMMRRGDVYVCTVVSVSGRQLRLIVDARSGHIVERYAARNDRPDNEQLAVRPPRSIGRDDGDDDPYDAIPRQRQALGDPYSPPRRSSDDAFAPRSDDSAAPAEGQKPRHHVAKKRATTSVVRAPATPSTPDTATAPKPDPTTAAVAPSAPTPAPAPVKPVETARPVAVAPAVPAPAPAATPSPEPVQARAEPRRVDLPKPEPAPLPAKPEPAHKKLNDLPVGTLD